jgi:hypothetical protein
MTAEGRELRLTPCHYIDGSRYEASLMVETIQVRVGISHSRLTLHHEIPESVRHLSLNAAFQQTDTSIYFVSL